MEFTARIIKEGKFWLGEIKELELITQGRSRKEAVFMVKDLLNEMLFDQFGKKIIFEVLKEEKEALVISIKDLYAIPFVLKRLRTIKGRTIKEISKQCGFKSLNAYAQYEQGKRIPGLLQFEKLLEIMGVHLKIAVSL